MFVVWLDVQVRKYCGQVLYNSRLDSRDLCLGLRALFKLSHLLALDRRCGNLLTENDIADFARSEGRDIDAVTLAKVPKKTSELELR
jgi:hypothetical protein